MQLLIPIKETIHRQNYLLFKINKPENPTGRAVAYKSRLHLVAKTIKHTKINSCLRQHRARGAAVGTHTNAWTGRHNSAEMCECKKRLIGPRVGRRGSFAITMASRLVMPAADNSRTVDGFIEETDHFNFLLTTFVILKFKFHHSWHRYFGLLASRPNTTI